MGTVNIMPGEPVRFERYKPLVPIREANGIVFVSGHGPEDINTYEPLFRGRVGADLTLEEGYQAASECAKTLMRAVQQRFGTLDCIHHLVRATALVNCAEGFEAVDKVVDGFSDTCMKILQERGFHTRTIMGTRNMPNHNIPVEVELIFVLADRYRNTLGGNQDVSV
jgi:endoribonuclease L-PSP, putative